MSRIGFILLAICVSRAAAQTPRSRLGSSLHARDLKGPAHIPRADTDHTLVWEFGAAADWEPADGSVHPGGTVALELTPIEDRLELECGMTALAANGGVEMPVDVLFKKPWRLSPQFEFMIGAGPEIVQAFGPNHATFWGGEVVLDFMFWPRANIGWYVERRHRTVRIPTHGAPTHPTPRPYGIFAGSGASPAR
jgi:hypothetical protein